MTQQSEQALNSIKRVIDIGVMKGGIFGTMEGVIDAVNAYNYIVGICESHDVLSKQVNTPPVPQKGELEAVNHK
jgi:hypothetical protein